MRAKAAVAGSLLSVLMTGVAEATEVPAGEVDALFSQWTAPDTPGCAVSVVQGQALVFERGYGRAVLESGEPNTPVTGFNLASVSKQFTAFAIHLLREDGRLSLEDDVRDHVPELHDFGATITLRHLLHHTSGLRDQGHLLFLQGRRYEDTTTQDDALSVILAQRELNFAPGTRFAYSNANYVLLALVVERVSGRSFADFMAGRVFRPLGMTDTFVRDNVRDIRTRQAWPYAKAGGGHERRFLPNATRGASNIHSTARDMALWAAHMDGLKGRSPALAGALSSTGVDGEGRPIRYASGLVAGRYRGAITLEHGGSEPGYSTQTLRWPEQGLGVTILCNVEGLDLREKARRIGDLYLADRLDAVVDETPTVLTEAELARFAGSYRAEPGAVFGVELRDGRLFLQGQQPLTPVGPATFVVPGTAARFSFEGDAAGGASALVIHDPDNDRRAERMEPSGAPDLTSQMMDAYAGRYFSAELGAVLSVERRGEGMWLSVPGFSGPLVQPPPILREVDVYASPIGGLAFARDADGRVTGVAISNGALINLRYERLPGL